MPRPDHRQALRDSGVLDALADFDPHVAGTPPLGLDLPASDIDILCHAPEAIAFAECLWRHFADRAGFSLRQWTRSGRPVIAAFHACGWNFEVFGAAEPVATQVGWRHFRIEQRLLALGGDGLRQAVMELRHQGMKTEPAFAAALKLEGDPHAALLRLEALSDDEIALAYSPGTASR